MVKTVLPAALKVSTVTLVYQRRSLLVELLAVRKLFSVMQTLRCNLAPQSLAYISGTYPSITRSQQNAVYMCWYNRQKTQNQCIQCNFCIYLEGGTQTLPHCVRIIYIQYKTQTPCRR